MAAGPRPLMIALVKISIGIPWLSPTVIWAKNMNTPMKLNRTNWTMLEVRFLFTLSTPFE